MSYRSVESTFSLRLVKDLHMAGFAIWMDQLDGIRGSDDWVMQLQNAIDSAKGILIALSPEYTRSKVCRRELTRADGYGLPMFPLLIETVEKTQLPLELQRIQHIDFRNWQNEVSYQTGLAKLKRDLQDRGGIQPGLSLAIPTPPQMAFHVTPLFRVLFSYAISNSEQQTAAELIESELSDLAERFSLNIEVLIEPDCTLGRALNRLKKAENSDEPFHVWHHLGGVIEGRPLFIEGKDKCVPANISDLAYILRYAPSLRMLVWETDTLLDPVQMKQLALPFQLLYKGTESVERAFKQFYSSLMLRPVAGAVQRMQQVVPESNTQLLLQTQTKTLFV